MNLSSLFIKRPVMTTLVMLAIVFSGIMAYLRLPVSDVPIVDKPKLNVHTHYSGASPEVVLNEITIPLEKALSIVKGVKEMSSSSSSGHSSISLRFDLGKNMDEAVQDVVAALNKAEGELPKNLTSRPKYFREENDKDPIMGILLTSKSASSGELRQYANLFLLPRLERIEGVGKAQAMGSEKAIWLKVNPDLLAARKIGFNQVIDTVKAFTSQSALGTIETQNKLLSLEIKDAIKHTKELENLYIIGSNVQLKDIGTISTEAADEKEFHYVTKESVETTVAIIISKASDANTVAISKDVHELIDAIQNELPSEIHAEVWFDKAVWIQESIDDVQWSLIFAFLLVVVVIYLSLGRLTDALIPSVALPLSLVGTFSIMYLLDYSLDLLSLLALTLSVGFVVDDAIVVLEAIVKKQEEGEDMKKASLNGSKQISFTVLSMTLSLVAVFIPLLFMTGSTGKLFREFSVTLAVAILVSGFISLTLTPMMCSRFLSSKAREHKVSRFTLFYEKTLKKVLAYPKTVLLSALLLMGITVPLYTKLPVILSPPEDRGFLFTVCNLPTGLSQQDFARFQADLEKIMQKNPNINSFFDFCMGNALIFFTQLVPKDVRPPQQAVVQEIQATLDSFVGCQSFTMGYSLINLDTEFGEIGQYKYNLHGINAEEVEQASLTLAEALKVHPEFSYVDVSLKNDFPKLVIDVNEHQAHLFGITQADVQEVLSHAFGHASIGTRQLGTHRDEIYMKMLPEFEKQPSSLSYITFAKDDNTLVPFKAFASWSETFAKPEITRKEQMPSATIMFSVANGVKVTNALHKVEEVAAKVLPKQVSGDLSGSSKRIANAMGETLMLFLAAAIVMYIVLGILYESFIHPITILSSLPFAGLGGILTLFLFKEPISIFSAVGFLLLLGIVKKNGIMMVDYALEAKSQGKSTHDAIIEGSIARFRPIMMTTLAAIMGAIPIAIGFGEGAEMRRGLGLVICGGLLFSQLLTLYVTPVIFCLLDRKRTVA